MLFGLVSCSVPPKLKAELLHTITAFASTPETGTALWQSMEMSQVFLFRILTDSEYESD